MNNLDCVKKLKAKYKVLIMGNHDKGASNYKRTYQTGHLEPLENGGNIYVTDTEDNHLFDEVYEGPLMINDRLILSHEPIEDLPMYMFNIHGHTHDLPNIYDERHLNVCAEAIGYIPVSLSKLLKEGLLSKTPSIHRFTIERRLQDK